MAREHRSTVHHRRRAHTEREMDIQQSAHRLAVAAFGLRQLHLAPGFGDRRGLRELHVHGLERLRIGERDHLVTSSRQVQQYANNNYLFVFVNERIKTAVLHNNNTTKKALDKSCSHCAVARQPRKYTN